MQPAIYQNRNSIQLSYEQRHNIHTSVVNPVRSPNGSRIIIYGHEGGLRVIWYGGRPYQKPASVAASAEVNGTSKDGPMVIDLSDDDDEPDQSVPQAAVFEDEEDEVDPAKPYKDVLRNIDIELATSATHLAVPYISPSQRDSSSGSHAPILSSHLVVAAACSDLKIRLISLPLTPPPVSSLKSLTWGMQVVQIPASSGHQDSITSIAITDFAEDYSEEADEDRNKSRSRSGARVSSESSKQRSGMEWSFLVASTSCTGSGLLLIHRISVTDQNTFDQSPDALLPCQRRLLRTPLSACRLQFNTCPHPADRASNLLITLPDSGCVKVYQVISQSTHTRGRRGSGATLDSTTSGAGSVRGSSKHQGRFLITLYSAFLPLSEYESFGRRKRLLDASWVLGGRAILAMFEDGDWGVWDLEASGPPSTAHNQNLVKGQNTVSGIQGGAQATFTTKGSVFPYGTASLRTDTETADLSGKTTLTPMTPHTRKTRSDLLFDSREADSLPTIGKATYSRGNIVVAELQQTPSTQSEKFADESVLLNYGDSFFYLPSLLTFWRAEVSGRGTIRSSSASRPIVMSPLRLAGQQIQAISLFPIEQTASGPDDASTNPEFCVVTDHTLILLLSPLEESASQAGSADTLSTRLPSISANTNELLLERGELGIDGLDNMLNDMRRGSVRNDGSSFGFDRDMYVDMHNGLGTPVPKSSGRSKPARGTPSASFRPGQSKVRLFS